uniref:Calpain 8 gene 5 n=1 Tax=Xenopus tropicalis TaxID=8364 RepID=A0A803JDC3_XENTR
MAQPEGTKENPKKYLEQDYEQLKAQCLASNTLFEDEKFPAGQASLGSNKMGPESSKAKGIVWMRPLEINPNAEFITDGATRFDICQSTIADCGFLSTIGCATLSEEYLSLVLPQDQNFKTNYAGIFHFKFWQRGEWLDVVVDDKLPTRDKKLVFVKSAEENEFWPALLEKAFAKLRGSYEALEYQYSTVALQHFTGGVCLWYFLKKHQFPKIQRAVKSKCLLTSSTVSYKGEKVQLVRLRNPWGYKEWTGAWSDNAPEWNDVAQEVKDALLTQKDDGEFWIPFLDMVKDYESLDICHIAPSKEVNVEEPHWSLMQTEGSWKKGDSAERFLADPQFRIKLEVPDDDDDQDAAEDKALCTVIVALMSKEILEKVPDFLLYQLPKEVPTNLLVKDLKAMARERVNNRNKEYVGCFQVQKGEYAVIPNPSDPNQDFDFYIRVYYRKKGGSLEKDGEVTNTSE